MRNSRKKKTLMHFISVTQQLIEEEGMSNVTIRKVADLAEYNSATIYNYFRDLDHLLLFASLKYLTQYNVEVVARLQNCDDKREGFKITWDSFCNVSFRHPEAFFKIFFNKHSMELNELANQYYELFPEERDSSVDIMIPIFSIFDIGERNDIALRDTYENSDISSEEIDIMNDLMIHSYHALLLKRLSNQDNHPVEWYTAKMFSYIDFIMDKRR